MPPAPSDPQRTGTDRPAPGGRWDGDGQGGCGRQPARRIFFCRASGRSPNPRRPDPGRVRPRPLFSRFGTLVKRDKCRLTATAGCSESAWAALRSAPRVSSSKRRSRERDTGAYGSARLLHGSPRTLGTGAPTRPGRSSVSNRMQVTGSRSAPIDASASVPPESVWPACACCYGRERRAARSPDSGRDRLRDKRGRTEEGGGDHGTRIGGCWRSGRCCGRLAGGPRGPFPFEVGRLGPLGSGLDHQKNDQVTLKRKNAN